MIPMNTVSSNNFKNWRHDKSHTFLCCTKCGNTTCHAEDKPEIAQEQLPKSSLQKNL